MFLFSFREDYGKGGVERAVVVVVVVVVLVVVVVVVRH